MTVKAVTLASGQLIETSIDHTAITSIGTNSHSTIDSHLSSTSNPHSVTKSQVGLGSVENTALSTWAGSTSITTLGTIATGVWSGTALVAGKVPAHGSLTGYSANEHVPSMTAGSIAFHNGTILSQDNANLFWDDTNNRLGIGTASPNSSLNIVGTTAQTFCRINTTTGNASYAMVTDTSSFFFLGSGAVNRFSIYDSLAGVSRLAIDGSGNVGIGTVAQTALLDARGDVDFDVGTFHVDSTNNRVGIGTASPSYPLHVVGDGYFTGSVGVGSPAGAHDRLYVYVAVSDATAAKTGAKIQLVHTLTAANSQITQGNTCIMSTYLGGYSAATSRGYYANLSVNDAGSITNAIGYSLAIANNDTATVSSVIGYQCPTSTNGGGGTVTTVTGFYCGDQTVGTNNYGFRGLVTLGSGRYNLYMSGNAANYLAGDLGIGTTSPTAKLDVRGDVDIDVGTFHVDSTNNRVGIGTASPSYPLHIYEGSAGGGTPSVNVDTVVFESNGSSGMTFMAPDASYSRIAFGSPSDSYGARLQWNFSELKMVVGTASAGASMAFTTGNDVEKMRLDSAGNLGIGVTDPELPLTIAATSATTNQINLRSYRAALVAGNNLGGIEFWSNDTNLTAPGSVAAKFEALAFNAHTASTLNTDFVWSTTNVLALAEKMRLSYQGYLGIGTSTPTALIDVNSDILRLRTAKTPATAGAAGNQGDIAWDANYIYVCTATNTWKRSAIATW